MDFYQILEMTGETLLMTLISTFFAYLLGLPTGVFLSITAKSGLRPNKLVNTVISILVNFIRSVPCLIIIVVCIPWTRAWLGKGTGKWYSIIRPLTVCAFGFVARMVEQSLAEVPAGEIEAVKSLGATDWQIVYKVLIPEARSSLISGVAVVLVSIIGYTSFAYNIAAGGLIAGIYSHYNRNTGSYMSSPYFWVMIAAVVLIVQVLQEAGLKIAKKLDKRKKSQE